MREKMLVTQALDERDLLVKKISDKIDKASFVDTIKPNEDRIQAAGVEWREKYELPEYKEISDKYREEEKRLEEYRRKCKDEAIDMLKQYFYDLWD